MKITRFKNFILNESKIDKREIQELFEDYFLELMDGTESNSTIRIDGWTSESDYQAGEFVFTSSKKSEGCIPVYNWELKLNTFYPMQKVQNIIDRISKDSDFSIISSRAHTIESLSNGSIGQKTEIGIKFIYLLTPKFSLSKDLQKALDDFKNLRYEVNVHEYGESYFWFKRINKQVEMPVDWFSKNKQHGYYKPLTSKTELVQNRIQEEFGGTIQTELQNIQSVIGELPQLELKRNNWYRLTAPKQPWFVAFEVEPFRETRLESKLVTLSLLITINYNNR